MKNKSLVILFILAIGCIVAITAKAQTPVPPPQVAGFINEIPAYFSSFDTNTLVAEGSKLEIFNDMLSGGSLGLSGLMGVRLNFAAPKAIPVASANTGFAVAGLRYAGVGGVISGGDAGIGWSYVKWDTRLSLSMCAGYEKQGDGGRGTYYFGPGIWLEKAVSKTLPGIGLDFPTTFSKSGKVAFCGSPQFRVKVSIPF